ncbi:MAG TPA: hypothetical protein VHX65_04070 [Pirellulales bacterium]|nr:hypothetical protein [Pirellulales bacterium]
MRTRSRQLAACTISCTAFLLFAPAARAQLQPGLQPGQRVINLPTFKTTGEYVGMSGGYMKAILDGTQVIVQFDAQKSKVKVTGRATADFLAPGMYVQFKGTFDRFGKGTEPIKDFVIFSPDANNQPGAYEAGGGNAFDEPAPRKKGPHPKTTEYSCAGRITAAHKNIINVNCGNLKVKAEVAPDAKVKLDASDPSWASPGDKLTISGAKLGGDRVLGIDVAIELARPLEPKKKHGTHLAATSTEEKSTEKTTDKNAKPADKTDKDKPKTDKAAGDKAGDAKSGDAKGADTKAGDAKNPNAKKPADNADAGK